MEAVGRCIQGRFKRLDLAPKQCAIEIALRQHWVEREHISV
jgi:hypothetical protein